MYRDVEPISFPLDKEQMPTGHCVHEEVAVLALPAFSVRYLIILCLLLTGSLKEAGYKLLSNYEQSSILIVRHC